MVEFLMAEYILNKKISFNENIDYIIEVLHWIPIGTQYEKEVNGQIVIIIPCYKPENFTVA
jgi:hypothetical protein